MPTVDAKVRISGHDHRVGQCLAHTHQASIVKTHWHVRVLFNEAKNILELISRLKTGLRYLLDNSSRHTRQDRMLYILARVWGQRISCLQENAVAFRLDTHVERAPD